MKDEYETIVSSGLDLQLDCPDLALSRHMLFNDLSDEEFIKVAGLHIDALNFALSDISADNVRIHICWGNYEGPHICDIPMSKMFDTLMAAKAGYVLFETSNPRHGHEWTSSEIENLIYRMIKYGARRGRHDNKFCGASRISSAKNQKFY